MFGCTLRMPWKWEKISTWLPVIWFPVFVFDLFVCNYFLSLSLWRKVPKCATLPHPNIFIPCLLAFPYTQLFHTVKTEASPTASCQWQGSLTAHINHQLSGHPTLEPILTGSDVLFYPLSKQHCSEDIFCFFLNQKNKEKE